jgi:hypothetical protein
MGFSPSGPWLITSPRWLLALYILFERLIVKRYDEKNITLGVRLLLLVPLGGGP